MKDTYATLWMLVLIILCHALQQSSGDFILPPSWSDMCSVKLDNSTLLFYTDQHIPPQVWSVWCEVGQDNNWRLDTLQSWLHTQPSVFSLFVVVSCSPGGVLSLPWPMKARGLVGIIVSNCMLLDKYNDVINPEISSLPDQLRVLDLRDSVWLDDSTTFDLLTQPEILMAMGADYDCGQDNTIEVMVMSNVTDDVSDASVSLYKQNNNTNSNRISGNMNNLSDLSINYPESSKKTNVEDTISWNKQAGDRKQQKSGFTHSDFIDSFLANQLIYTPSESPPLETISLPAKLSEPTIKSLTATSLRPADPVYSPTTADTDNTNAAFNQPHEDVSRKITNNPLPSVATSTDDSPLTHAEKDYLDLLKNIESIQYRCVYKKLRILDESLPDVMSVHHFAVMVDGGEYPELRVLNYSRSGLREIPRELHNFRRHFPKLSYLDLSGNDVSSVTLLKPPLIPSDQSVTFNLQHNQIKSINLSIVQSWADVSDVFVDIRYNPVDCSCYINDLLLAMKMTDFFTRSMQRYEYLKDLECHTPIALRGNRLSDVQLNCSNTFSDTIVAKPTGIDSLSPTNLTIVIVFGGVGLVSISILVVIVATHVAHWKMWQPEKSTKHEKSPNTTVCHVIHGRCQENSV